jgi:eukaryotic-like serine/threonine-protein kinase
MAADRHLLFGLLALQTGLIQQAQLVAAFHAWTCDKSRSLADHLIGLGHLDAARRAAVEALAAVHIEAHGGDAGRSLAAVPAGPSTRESLAELGDPDIEATLGHVGSGRGTTEPDGQDDPDRTTDYSVGSVTSDGQRFRVLRPHARGGRGAVFVALDRELHREVALKQLLDEHADDPVSQARFLLEAEVTGGLEHPGIVPVYGLGAYAGGRPYYAMRFIRGDSLKETIGRFHADETLKADLGRRSLELRKLLRRFLDVCNAIDYAHSRGVIHRDIKPANIVVGKYGETLMVDWGLAKVTGRSDPGAGERTLLPSLPSGSSETLPGSTLGTPAYMSPEQARGELEHLGPRSDVYSLGATLYVLLTGKPPQEGDDIGEVLRRVQHGEFPRPRQLDASIDPALEAVCLRAMALQPRDRYASPRLLAEDIERWMADEPVTVWREPFSRRLSRWVTRHRTGVTGVAAAVLAGVVGLAAVLAVQSSANARLSASLDRETRANEDLASANAELGRSKAAVQARYDLAVEAIRAFHTGVSEDFLLKEDRFKELRDRLLKSASDFYGKLGALLGRESDVGSRRALTRANFELARLTDHVGRKDAALAAHRSVLAEREAIAAEPGADVEAKVNVGRSLIEVATLLDATGKTGEALTAYRRSEAMLAGLAGSDPAARAALAAGRTSIGRLLLYTGKSQEALTALKLARADQEAPAAAPAASRDARRELAETLQLIGYLLWYTGRPAEALPEYRTAGAIYQRLADEDPAVIEFRRGLAASHFYLGIVLMLTGRPSEAELELRTAVAMGQEFADENPAVTRFRRALAIDRYFLGNLLVQTGRPAEAEIEFRTAVAILQEVANDHPAVAEFRVLLELIRSQRGLLLSWTGRPAEGEAECRTAVETVQKLADDNPANTLFRVDLVQDLINLGDVLRSRGRPAEARDCYERAIALKEPDVREDRSNESNRSALAGALWRRGLTRSDLGDPAGADDDVRRALSLCVGLPPRSGYEFETACCHAVLAGLAGRPGSGVSADEGQAAADRAMEWLRRAVAMGYRNTNEIRIESALDPLRSRDDFRLIMMDLNFPDELFAPGP